MGGAITLCVKPQSFLCSLEGMLDVFILEDLRLSRGHFICITGEV